MSESTVSSASADDSVHAHNYGKGGCEPPAGFQECASAAQRAAQRARRPQCRPAVGGHGSGRRQADLQADGQRRRGLVLRRQEDRAVASGQAPGKEGGGQLRGDDHGRRRQRRHGPSRGDCQRRGGCEPPAGFQECASAAQRAAQRARRPQCRPAAGGHGSGRRRTDLQADGQRRRGLVLRRREDRAVASGQAPGKEGGGQLRADDHGRRRQRRHGPSRGDCQRRGGCEPPAGFQACASAAQRAAQRARRPQCRPAVGGHGSGRRRTDLQADGQRRRGLVLRRQEDRAVASGQAPGKEGGGQLRADDHGQRRQRRHGPSRGDCQRRGGCEPPAGFQECASAAQRAAQRARRPQCRPAAGGHGSGRRRTDLQADGQRRRGLVLRRREDRAVASGQAPGKEGGGQLRADDHGRRRQRRHGPSRGDCQRRGGCEPPAGFQACASAAQRAAQRARRPQCRPAVGGHGSGRRRTDLQADGQRRRGLVLRRQEDRAVASGQAPGKEGGGQLRADDHGRRRQRRHGPSRGDCQRRGGCEPPAGFQECASAAQRAAQRARRPQVSARRWRPRIRTATN